MHHFRGRVLDDGKPYLDPANIYIQFYHALATGSVPSWSGYLLVDSEAVVEVGGSYTIVLVDGRRGEVHIDHFAPDESGKVRAYFDCEGPLK